MKNTSHYLVCFDCYLKCFWFIPCISIDSGIHHFKLAVQMHKIVMRDTCLLTYACIQITISISMIWHNFILFTDWENCFYFTPFFSIFIVLIIQNWMSIWKDVNLQRRNGAFLEKRINFFQKWLKNDIMQHIRTKCLISLILQNKRSNIQLNFVSELMNLNIYAYVLRSKSIKINLMVN